MFKIKAAEVQFTWLLVPSMGKAPKTQHNIISRCHFKKRGKSFHMKQYITVTGWVVLILTECPFNTLYYMFYSGNAWEESVSTIPLSLSGRTWLLWRQPAPCLASPSTKTRYLWWQGSQTQASPALRRSTTLPPTSETAVFLFFFYDLLYLMVMMWSICPQ